MAPPPTPLKRPTLNLKRDSSYLDTDDEAGLSSSTKKLRFDPNIDVRIMDDWTDKSFDLVKEEVKQGIERHIAPLERRDDTQYAKLLHLLGQDAFSSEAPSTRLLTKYVLAIDSRISSLGECGKLAVAVLDVSWIGRDDTFVALFTRFLCDLATAHAKFIPTIMERLATKFSKLPASLGRLPEETPVPRAKMFARLHLAIRTLLKRIPSGSNALLRVLKLEFPNDLSTTRSYLQYEKHLLRLADNVPELKAEILSLIVQRLVGMDVQIQQDLEELEDEAEDKVLQRPSSKDGRTEDSDDSDIESVSESEETMTEEEQRLRELRLKVAKMDGTLNLLFEYYKPLVEDGSRPESNEAYQQLLSHFTTYILPNRCRHTQFLLFHFSQTSPAHTTLFAEQCLQLAMANVSTSTHRLAACAYLSSFIARGARTLPESVRSIFIILCRYLDDMRQKYEPNTRGPDRRSYSLYYAVAQAILYIFCFRWRDLVTGYPGTVDYNEVGEDIGISEEDALAEGYDLDWLPGVKEIMTQNIYCRLNPLKVCSQAIVGEFAKIAHYLHFMYIFSLLESNKRVRLGQTFSFYSSGGGVDMGRRETAWDRKTGDAHHQLEAYFPFDPYHLPKSKHWVANDYNEWKLPTGMQKDDEDEGSESEGEGESEDESLPEEEDVEYATTNGVTVVV